MYANNLYFTLLSQIFMILSIITIIICSLYLYLGTKYYKVEIGNRTTLNSYTYWELGRIATAWQFYAWAILGSSTRNSWLSINLGQVALTPNTTIITRKVHRTRSSVHTLKSTNINETLNRKYKSSSLESYVLTH